MNESPIFTHTHDLLRWLLATTRKFPREYRFTLSERLVGRGFAFQDAITAAVIDAAHTQEHLIRADIALTGLRKTLLLCLELDLLQPGQYRHASEMTATVGRLLGSWRNPKAKSGPV